MMARLAVLLVLLLAAVSIVHGASASIVLNGAAAGNFTVKRQGIPTSFDSFSFTLRSDVAGQQNVTSVQVACSNAAGNKYTQAATFAVGAKVSSKVDFSYTIINQMFDSNPRTATCTFTLGGDANNPNAGKVDPALAGAIMPPTTVFTFVREVGTGGYLRTSDLQQGTRSNECVLSAFPVASAGFLQAFGFSGAASNGVVNLGLWRLADDGASYRLVATKSAQAQGSSFELAIKAEDQTFPVQAGDRVGACYQGRSPFYEAPGQAGAANLTVWAYSGAAGAALQLGSTSGALSQTQTSNLNIRAITSAAPPQPFLQGSGAGQISSNGAAFRLTSSFSNDGTYSPVAVAAGGVTVDTACYLRSSSGVTSFAFNSPFVIAAGSSSAVANLTVPGVGSWSCSPFVRASGARDSRFDFASFGPDLPFTGTSVASLGIARGLTANLNADPNLYTALPVGGAAQQVQLTLSPAPSKPVQVLMSCAGSSGQYAAGALTFTWTGGAASSDVQSLAAPAAGSAIGTVYQCSFSVVTSSAQRDTDFDTASTPQGISLKTVSAPQFSLSPSSGMVYPSTVTSQTLLLTTSFAVSPAGATFAANCVVQGTSEAAFTGGALQWKVAGGSSASLTITLPRRASAATTYSCTLSVVTTAVVRDTLWDLATSDSPYVFTTAAGQASGGGDSAGGSSDGSYPVNLAALLVLRFKQPASYFTQERRDQLAVAVAEALSIDAKRVSVSAGAATAAADRAESGSAVGPSRRLLASLPSNSSSSSTGDGGDSVDSTYVAVTIQPRSSDSIDALSQKFRNDFDNPTSQLSASLALFGVDRSFTPQASTVQAQFTSSAPRGAASVPLSLALALAAAALIHTGRAQL